MVTAPVEITPEPVRIVRLLEQRLDRAIALADGSLAHATRLDHEIAESERSLFSAPTSRLGRLISLFRIGELERSALLTALGPVLEPRLHVRYAQFHDRPWATESLAALLFDHGTRPLLSDSSPSVTWALLQVVSHHPGEPPILKLDESVRHWLFGSVPIDQALHGLIRPVEVMQPLRGWRVSALVDRVTSALKREQPVCLTISGLPGSGRATLAANVANKLGMGCYLIKPHGSSSVVTPEQIRLAHRLAIVGGALLVWRSAAPELRSPLGNWPVPVQAVTLQSGDSPPNNDQFAVYEHEIPCMRPKERRRLICRHVPTAESFSRVGLEQLSNRSTLTPGVIQRLARVAPLTDTEALDLVNSTHSSVMEELARPLASDLNWDDIVLPPPMKQELQDLTFEHQGRDDVWRNAEVQRLFANERGLVALFKGPPGTGKTMAAQVIANAIGTDLLRVDSASIQSRYVGDTAKNLRRIFARAKQLDSILFFDEADALWSKRTDIKDTLDKFANSDTSYALQLLETEFRGFAILASNRAGDLDPAMTRRIRYIFDFRRPEMAEREQIWHRSASTLIAACDEKLPADLWSTLAEVLNVTGAQIKAILIAAFFASERRGSVLSISDILRAAEREYGKEGRVLSARDQQRIRRHG